MDLTQPPVPTWWEQQAFTLRRREAELAAQENWLRDEQELRFPARCEKRALDYQQQLNELILQSQQRLQRAFFGNALSVLMGTKVGRPALTRTQEGVTLDNGIASLRRTFYAQHERDAQWVMQQASILLLRRNQLEADKQTLRDLAKEFGVALSL